LSKTIQVRQKELLAGIEEQINVHHLMSNRRPLEPIKEDLVAHINAFDPDANPVIANNWYRNFWILIEALKS